MQTGRIDNVSFKAPVLTTFGRRADVRHIDDADNGITRQTNFRLFRFGINVTLCAVVLCLSLKTNICRAQVDPVEADTNSAHDVQVQPDQSAAPAPEDQAVAPADAPNRDDVFAEVIEVRGAVERADAGVSPLTDDGWTPVQVGDRLPAGTQLRTGLRSHVNLRFGETTVMSMRSATHASIDDFYRSATEETVRVGLGYGTVRGSSSEGTLRSDVTVDSTIATLAKRGTEGWEMSFEPMTGRFRISLAESGLVEAIRKLQGGRTVSRTVAPGEYATRNNIANLWIAQAVFDRNVTFYEASSVTTADADFTAANTSGLGNVGPGGGSQLAAATRRADAGAILNRSNVDRATRVPNTAVIQPGLLSRPEGDFGTPDTFRILLPQQKSAWTLRTSAGRGLIPHRERR